MLREVEEQLGRAIPARQENWRLPAADLLDLIPDESKAPTLHTSILARLVGTKSSGKVLTLFAIEGTWDQIHDVGDIALISRKDTVLALDMYEPHRWPEDPSPTEEGTARRRHLRRLVPCRPATDRVDSPLAPQWSTEDLCGSDPAVRWRGCVLAGQNDFDTSPGNPTLTMETSAHYAGLVREAGFGPQDKLWIIDIYTVPRAALFPDGEGGAA